MQNIVIVSATRTAVGKFEGSLRDYEAHELGGIAIGEAIKRAGIPVEKIDEVVMGCVASVAENAFLARLAAMKAGLPIQSTALTVNRLCASGLQSIVTAAMEIQTGFASVCVAGGAESMNNIPHYLRKARFGYRMGHGELEDGLITALTDPFSRQHMGITAENIAEKYGITRQAQDEFALLSQQRAQKAVESGVLQPEIVPVQVQVSRKETKSFEVDEHPRLGSTLESLIKLRPAFKEGGTVTAGNSSGINDGAAAVVLMSEETARELGCEPMVRLVGAAVAGVEPGLMGTGPIPAVRKLLAQTGVSLADIGLIELNEAFAVQALACIQELGMDINKVNVNGGAIALGHPIGATGSIITVKLLYEMKRRQVKYGLATLCIGGGQGLAILYELWNGKES